MGSDQDMGKKEIETNDLIPFLEAREVLTGEKLSLIPGMWSECPDFIVARPDGALLGIELTKVTEHDARIYSDRLRLGEACLNTNRTLDQTQCLIERKEKARVARYAKKVTNNILVLQLVGGSLDLLQGAFDGLEGDFTSHGFSEIWLADYSGLEAYGDIELFGLFPRQWWGHHSRPWPDRKPYG